MAKGITPKGCLAQSVSLDGKGNAEVRFACPRPGSLTETEYASRHLRGVRSVHLTEGTVSGHASVGFVQVGRQGEYTVCHRT